MTLHPQEVHKFRKEEATDNTRREFVEAPTCGSWDSMCNETDRQTRSSQHSTPLWGDQSINQSISQSTNQPTNQSTNLSINWFIGWLIGWLMDWLI